MITQNPLILDTRAARVFRLRKSVMTSARLINDRLSSDKWRWQCLMITLTYAPGVQWSPEHVSDMLRNVSRWGLRKGKRLPYLWVMEMTKAGIPHFHVLLWIPARWKVPYPDKRGWWSHGSTNLERARNPVGYVAKYASKFESKDAEFPRGARIHGVGGLTASEKRVVAWWKLPKDLRRGAEGSCSWRRAPGGGWVDRDTGERYFSPWSIQPLGDRSKYVVLVPSSMTSVQKQEIADYKAVFVRRRQLIKSVMGPYPVGRAKSQAEAVREMVEDRSWRANLNLSQYLHSARLSGINPFGDGSPAVRGYGYLVDVAVR